MLYGVWISVQEDQIRLKSIPSSNDEMTYLILVLVEDKRRGLPVELDGTSSSVDPLVRRRRHVDDMKRVEVGRMSGEWMSWDDGDFQQISPSLKWHVPPRSLMGKMSKEVPKPLSFLWKVSHAFVLVMDIFPSLCSPFRLLFYFYLWLVIFLLSFSWTLVIT